MRRLCDCCGLVESAYWVESVYGDGACWSVFCADCLEGWQGWQDCVSYKVETLTV